MNDLLWLLEVVGWRWCAVAGAALTLTLTLGWLQAWLRHRRHG